MGKCVNVSMSVRRGKGGVHGETGAKLDSETSQIACEMKQTTPGKKNDTKQDNTRPRKSVERGRLAQKQKKNRNKTKQTHFSFCSTYFRLQMTKQH